MRAVLVLFFSLALVAVGLIIAAGDRTDMPNARADQLAVNDSSGPDSSNRKESPRMNEKSENADAALKARLTPEQYRVTQQCGTEPPFTGKYYHHKADGTYRCVVCGNPLFESRTKYESGSGWPSFWQPAGENAVARKDDTSHGMVRTEVTCGKCGAHLGHVFEDGPDPTGLRYCINSASLDFANDTAKADSASAPTKQADK